MRILQQAVAANATVITSVEKPIVGFLAVLTPTTAARSLVELQAILDDSKATVQVLDTDGSRTRLFNAVALSALTSYATAGEGSLNTTSTTYSLYIPVSAGGALNITNNEVIDLELTLSRACNLTLYGIESAERSAIVPTFTMVDVPSAGAQKQYGVGESTALVIPPDSFQDIQLRYSNGVTAQMTADEMKTVAQLGNDQCVGGYFQLGADCGYITLPIDEVEELTVTSKIAGARFYIVKLKLVTNLDAVQMSNEALTTLAQIQTQ